MREIVVGTERFLLGERIGGGGEGEVFTVAGRSGQAVKIYFVEKRAAREDKVRAMVNGGLATQTDLVAYPHEIASDRSGNFLGFLMRLMPGYRPLHELYSPKSRQRHFPKADYRFLVRAALNVARGVATVHQTGCVIGDLNHSGVLVSQNATVAVIDADSFQYQTFSCLVGVEDFTPPELHGRNLATVDRTVAHDNFGLAIAIFHLLFMGRHPYAGVYKGPDISMGEAIAQNRFAFSKLRRSETQTSPPPGTLALDTFPAPIASAFERAFGLSAAARPNASDWINTLASLEGSLSRCSKVKSHYYPRNIKGCVWCELTVKSRFDMFPDLSTVVSDIPTDARGTEEAIREILAFRLPTSASILPQSVSITSGPSKALQEAKNTKHGRAITGLLLMAGAVVGLVSVPLAFIIWLGLAAWGWVRFSGSEVDARPFREAFEKADNRVQSELDAFVRRNNLIEALQVGGELAAAIGAYKRIDDDLARELRSLTSTREARQCNAYLDQFSVRQAKISGIGPAKTATLISFGIETAADVESPAIRRVPGFGDVMTKRLLDWRRTLEAGFRYNPARSAQDIADERALRARFGGQKAKLEATIQNGLSTLRAAKPRLDALSSKVQSDAALMQALEGRARAEQDLKLLGASIPASNVEIKFTPPPQPRSLQPPPPVIPQSPRAPTRVSQTPSCPRCRAPMRSKSGRFGQFWGCSRYPRCKGTRQI